MDRKDLFNEILNQGIDRLFKGESIDRIVADHPEFAEELEPLLRTTAAARAYTQVEPRPDFKARARYEFMTAAREMELKPQRHSWFRWRWQSAWSISLTALAAVILTGGGTVAAANYSMPGDHLYSVKIASEQVRLTFALSDITKTELNAKFANRRADEIEYLAAGGDAEEIQLATAKLNNNLTNISILSLGSHPADVSTQTMSNAMTFNTETATGSTGAIPGAKSAGAGGGSVQTTTEDGFRGSAQSGVNGQPSPTSNVPEITVTSAQPVIVPQPLAAPQTTGAPPPNQPADLNDHSQSMTDSTLTLKSAPENWNPLYGNENKEDDTTERPLTKIEKLRQILESNYLVRKASLEAALEKAQPELRPAIKQAIADSEVEYWKSLMNLERNTDSD